MAKKKKITLTDELITLISNIKIERFVFDDKQHYSHFKAMVNDLKLDDNKEYKEYNTRILEDLHSFEPQSRFGWGCDQWGLFGGTYLLEDVAMILGYYDKAIEGSENFCDGRRFPDDLEEKMYSLYNYICDNLTDIFSLVLNSMGNGGLKPGIYEFDGFNWSFKGV